MRRGIWICGFKKWEDERLAVYSRNDTSFESSNRIIDNFSKKSNTISTIIYVYSNTGIKQSVIAYNSNHFDESSKLPVTKQHVSTATSNLIKNETLPYKCTNEINCTNGMYPIRAFREIVNLASREIICHKSDRKLQASASCDFLFSSSYLNRTNKRQKEYFSTFSRNYDRGMKILQGREISAYEQWLSIVTNIQTGCRVFACLSYQFHRYC